MINLVNRYALAVACVAAPFLFGLWPSSVTVALLMTPSHVERMKLDYRLRDQPPPASPGAAGAATAASSEASPAPRFELVAQHFSGLVNYGLTSGFLYFVCAGALAVSAVIIRRRLGGRMVGLVIAAFAVVGALDVEPQDVVLGQTEPADRRFITDSGVWPVPVVTVQPEGQ